MLARDEPKKIFHSGKFLIYHAFITKCNQCASATRGNDTGAADPLDILLLLTIVYLAPFADSHTNIFKYDQSRYIRKNSSGSYKNLCTEIIAQIRTRPQPQTLLIDILENVDKILTSHKAANNYNEAGDFHALWIAFFTSQYELCQLYKSKQPSVLQSAATIASNIPLFFIRKLYHRLTQDKEFTEDRAEYVERVCNAIIACAHLPEFQEPSKTLLLWLLNNPKFHSFEIKLYKAFLAIDQTVPTCQQVLRLASDVCNNKTSSLYLPALEMLTAIQDKNMLLLALPIFFQLLKFYKDENTKNATPLVLFWEIYTSKNVRNNKKLQAEMIDWINENFLNEPTPNTTYLLMTSMQLAANKLIHSVDENLTGLVSKLFELGVMLMHYPTLYLFAGEKEKPLILLYIAHFPQELCFLDPTLDEFDPLKLLIEIKTTSRYSIEPLLINLRLQDLSDEEFKNLCQCLAQRLPASYENPHYFAHLFNLLQRESLTFERKLIIENVLKNVAGRFIHSSDFINKPPLGWHSTLKQDLKTLYAYIGLDELQQKFAEHKKVDQYLLYPNANSFFALLPPDLRRTLPSFRR